MSHCTNCQLETKNPKFCSRSCSVAYNNRKTPKRKRSNTYEVSCLCCGRPRKATFPGKYCSQKCANKAKSAKIVAVWLETGEAPADMREGHPIREHIYREQNNTCSLCPQGRDWNGKALNFILDHIDGNSYDSRRENLRLVCPNCEFQLPTSKGRNLGRGRHLRRERYALGLSR